MSPAVLYHNQLSLPPDGWWRACSLLNTAAALLKSTGTRKLATIRFDVFHFELTVLRLTSLSEGIYEACLCTNYHFNLYNIFSNCVF